MSRKTSSLELEEKRRLNEIGKVFFSEKAMTIDREQMLMVVQESIDYVKGPNVLELGYTDRGWTDALINAGFNLTVIEGSKECVDYARRKYGKIHNVMKKRAAFSPCTSEITEEFKPARLKIIHSLFEEFKTKERFNSIIMSCVLEHVRDPVQILKKAKVWSIDNGKIIIIVPNKYSLHRRIGYYLNMIESFDELSRQDLEVGHRRLYSIDEMLKDIQLSGLNGRFEKGIFLKPLSSDKLKDWPKELLWAYNKLGTYLPEWCAYLLFLAWPNKNN